MHVCISQKRVSEPQELELGMVESLHVGSCGFWELNPSAPQEQVLLTSELTLLSHQNARSLALVIVKQYKQHRCFCHFIYLKMVFM